MNVTSFALSFVPANATLPSMNTTPYELLAPAKDLDCGLAAIQCGADAVYIGGDRFGARRDASNSVEDIAVLAKTAHAYWVRVYATINTLLRENEVPKAVALAWSLYEAGVDALIIQDTGLLESDLPPVPLIASTQMHNNAPEKVAFLEQVGFRRAILARELTLDEIRAIRAAAPNIELEFFVHGALCVCYSGQCYLSYSLGGRSGNRGQCAQPCRKAYRLEDGAGHVIDSGRHLLSLRDLNLSGYLDDLIDAGITSFKIEGRLKDQPYVANAVAYYRTHVDEALQRHGGRKSSSGTSTVSFTPNPDKTFNRGFSTYFLHGRSEPIGSLDTPKMLGEMVGQVTAVTNSSITVKTPIALHPGDGLCFFVSDRQLCGTSINRVEGDTIEVQNIEDLRRGTVLYRNLDHAFLADLKKAKMDRRIDVAFTVADTPDGLTLRAEDENGVIVELASSEAYEPAQNAEKARTTLQNQLMKTGATEFRCTDVTIELDPVRFIPVAALNAWRRDILAKLVEERCTRFKPACAPITPNDVPYPEDTLTYFGNVLNKKAEAFYRRHGVRHIDRAPESGVDLMGEKVMTCRYCVKHELDLCPRYGGSNQYPGPLYLIDRDGTKLELRFDCAHCQMEVYLVLREGLE